MASRHFGAPLCAIAAMMLAPSVAGAAIVNVNTPVDEYGGSSACSVRDAIQSVNQDSLFGGCTNSSVSGFDDDYVVLPAGTYKLTIPPDGTPDDNQDGDLDINDTTTGGDPANDDLTWGAFDPINGDPAHFPVLDANGLDRAAEVSNTGGDQEQVIGGIDIRNGSSNFGGGVYAADNTVHFAKADFYDNKVSGYGGAVWSDGELRVHRSTFSGNEAGFSGGAIEHSNDTLIVGLSTFTDNEAAGTGGAIDAFNASDPLITTSTFHLNTADEGGAIYFGTAVTPVVNTATITSNVANDPGNGGGIDTSATTTNVNETILASNTSGLLTANCDAGTFTGFYNLESADTCDFDPGGAKPSKINTDPLLGPLAFSGGFTNTRGPLAGSPALDAIPSADCLNLTDQREVTRPDGSGFCDIGAFEGIYTPPPPAPTGSSVPTSAAAPSAAGAKCKKKRKKRKKKRCGKKRKKK